MGRVSQFDLRSEAAWGNGWQPSLKGSNPGHVLIPFSGPRTDRVRKPLLLRTPSTDGGLRVHPVNPPQHQERHLQIARQERP